MADDSMYVTGMFEDIVLRGVRVPERQPDPNAFCESERPTPVPTPSWEEMEAFLLGAGGGEEIGVLQEDAPPWVSQRAPAQPDTRLKEAAGEVSRALGKYLDALAGYSEELARHDVAPGEAPLREGVDDVMQRVSGDLRVLREVWSRAKR